MAKSHPRRTELTAEYLRSILDYDPETGVFRWRVRRSANALAGSITGRVNHSNGYACININYRHYFAHRLAWLHVYGEWPKGQIDHINGDRGDNRISNLRDGTPTQNGYNWGANRNTPTGFKGVFRVDGPRGFVARIVADGKRHYLGRFETAEEAHAAYAKAAAELHGEFANTGETS